MEGELGSPGAGDLQAQCLARPTAPKSVVLGLTGTVNLAQSLPAEGLFWETPGAAGTALPVLLPLTLGRQ